MSKNKQTKKSRFGKVLDYSLIVLSIVVLVFIIVYSVKINKGIAKEVKGAAYTLRVEILNAGLENGTENKLRDYLNTVAKSNIDLEVVNIERFTNQPSPETFIISRIKDSQGIVELAKLLKIEEDKIQFSELQHNNNHLTATIVIGTDSLIENLLHTPKELE